MYVETPAQLSGYRWQVFSDGLRDLGREYANAFLKGSLLEEIGRRVRGFDRIGQAQTNDGYTWFWGAYFNVRSGFLWTRKGSVALLFPWMSASPNNPTIERPIVACTDSMAGLKSVDSIVQKFTMQIQKHKLRW